MVTIGAVPAALFTECVLPTVSLDVVEYRQGNDVVNNVHKLPGLVRYGNLTLGAASATSSPCGTGSIPSWKGRGTWRR